MAISEDKNQEDENQIDQLLIELGIRLPEVKKEETESETPGLHTGDSQEYRIIIDLLHGRQPPAEAAS